MFVFHWKLIPVAILSMLIGALLAMAYIASQLPQVNPQTDRNTAIGRAAIGGAFTLTDHNGKTVTEKNLLGRYSLIYFGFTFCPDICPSELQVVSSALEALPPETAAKITPIFITVDPERDTAPKMAQYVANFHPRLIGYTGTVEQIKEVTAAYKVYYKKVKDENSSQNYTMDHSSILYLMGPDGYYVKHFSYGTSSTKITRSLKKLIR